MRIVVPVKPLAQAKSRLGTVLSAAGRAGVMRELLARVITAAREVAPVTVVTADGEIAARSRAWGAMVIDEGEVIGLNEAARLGADHARGRGDGTVMILAADLPDVTAEALQAMMHLARPDAMVIGPSRDGGTNALILSPRPDFQFFYGPDSFERHCGEAKRLGFDVIVHESPALSVDIDWPEDLARHHDLWAA
jgi:2-phospho-L-lactate guanylyltransferase